MRSHLLLALSVLSAGHKPAPPPPAKPLNVLYLLADDLRPEFGFAGQAVHTPNVDRLAANSVVFDRAYTQHAVCGPSRASFMTGTLVARSAHA